MNKQEVIETIETSKSPFVSEQDITFNYALDTALNIIKQLDEPEKPVLSKEEAEWLERLKKAKSFLNCLYIITRQGCYYGFEYYINRKQYKLPYGNDRKEDNERKNRLVNALIYGYEVEKEKLYTARLKVSGEYLNSEKANKKYMMGSTNKNYVKEFKSYCYTQTELEGLGLWDNPAFEIKEVTE